MPWQNNGDGGNKNPWGGGSGGGGDNGDGPRNPWGSGNNGGGQGGGGRRGNDFDDLLKRGQDRLKGLPGGGSGRNMWFTVGGVALLLWLASTSMYRVNEGEIGVLQTFGQYSGSQGPGLSFKLPNPIQTLTKVKVSEVRSMDVGSQGDEATDNNLVITGDQNLADIAYTIRWSIKDAKKYLFKIEDQQGTVQEVAESAMREAMSLTKMDDASGLRRAQVAAMVQKRMQDVLDSYDSGVRIVGVFIRQVDPPADVVSAFRDVTAAQQDVYTYTNQANAYRQQLIAQAQGDAARFNAAYEQFKLAPAVTRRRIYLETMEQVLAGTSKIIVDGKGVTPVLPLPQMLPPPAVVATAPKAKE
jgi:modulator of FtsH protease HflK